MHLLRQRSPPVAPVTAFKERLHELVGGVGTRVRAQPSPRCSPDAHVLLPHPAPSACRVLLPVPHLSPGIRPPCCSSPRPRLCLLPALTVKAAGTSPSIPTTPHPPAATGDLICSFPGSPACPLVPYCVPKCHLFLLKSNGHPYLPISVPFLGGGMSRGHP